MLRIIIAILDPTKQTIERLVMQQSEPLVYDSKFIDAFLLTLSRIRNLKAAEIPKSNQDYRRLAMLSDSDTIIFSDSTFNIAMVFEANDSENSGNTHEIIFNDDFLPQLKVLIEFT